MSEKKSPDNDVLQHGYQPTGEKEHITGGYQPKGVAASDGKISNQLPSNPPTGGSSEQKG